jgi:hypothetical protein
MIPSLSDYAIGEAALHRSLWNGCLFAHCPSLGNTGPKLYEFVQGQSAAISNYVASAWVYDNGLPVVENTESGTNTNRASYWTNLLLPSNAAAYSLWIYSAGQTTVAGCPITSGSTGVTFRMNVSTTGIITTSWGNGTLVRTAPTALAANTWTHVVSQRSRGGNSVELFIDGVLVDSAATGSTTTVVDSTVLSLLARNDSGTFTSRFAGRVDDARVYNRLLSHAEVRLLASQRAIAFIPRRRTTLLLSAQEPDAISGTAAATLGAATASATGEQTHTGTAAVTLGAATASATGQMLVTGTCALKTSKDGIVLLEAVGAITHTGTAAVTTDGATASASGSSLEGTVGAVAVTTDAATASGSGTQTHAGTVTAATTGPSATASGQVVEPTTGAVDHLLGTVTATVSGAVTVTGSVAQTSGAVTSASSGLVGVVGTGQGTAGALCVSTGLVGSGGAVNVTTSGVGVVLSGSVGVGGTVAVTTGAATLTASGLVPVVDVSLTGSIDRPSLTGRVDVQSLNARIAVENVEGKKLWR